MDAAEGERGEQNGRPGPGTRRDGLESGETIQGRRSAGGSSASLVASPTPSPSATATHAAAMPQPARAGNQDREGTREASAPVPLATTQRLVVQRTAPLDVRAATASEDQRATRDQGGHGARSCWVELRYAGSARPVRTAGRLVISVGCPMLARFVRSAGRRLTSIVLPRVALSGRRIVRQGDQWNCKGEGQCGQQDRASPLRISSALMVKLLNEFGATRQCTVEGLERRPTAYLGVPRSMDARPSHPGPISVRAPRRSDVPASGDPCFGQSPCCGDRIVRACRPVCGARM